MGVDGFPITPQIRALNELMPSNSILVGPDKRVSNQKGDQLYVPTLHY